MNNYLYTKYSITLHDLLLQEPDLLNFMILDTSAHTQEFIQMFIAYWDIYEICAETVESFKIILANTFAVHKNKYIELINAYETKINMLDGVVITEIDNDTRVNYELPRSATNKIDVPNSKNTNDKTRTTKGGNVIELKKEYLKQIRNIYAEFANEFSDCFLHIFY